MPEHDCIYEDDVKTIKDDVKEILKILNGNGDTGMCAKVNILWAGSVAIVGVVVITAIKTFLL